MERERVLRSLFRRQGRQENMMRILSVTAQKPSSTGSGVYLSQLVRQWNLAGHRQGVVFGGEQGDSFDLPDGVSRYPVLYSRPELPFPVAGMSDTMPYPSTRYRDFTPAMAEQFSNAFRQAVERAVEELDPDVILCHHLYLLTALARSWFPDRTVCAICHGTGLRQLESHPLRRAFIRERIPELQRIFALHQAQKVEIRQIFGCSKDRIHVVGAGYDSGVFYPRTSEREPCPFRQLVFAGKVSERKGVFSLLRALEYLPFRPDQLRVVLAGGHGDQREYEAIQAMARESGYPVALLGPLSQQELAEVFRDSDVFVLPSFSEGLPLVNLEALACGCRVVCSDLPGISSWYDQNVPNHGIRFVDQPGGGDSADSLFYFERNLALALGEALERPTGERPDLSQLTWARVAQDILEIAVQS